MREKIINLAQSKLQSGKVKEISFRTIAAEIGIKSSSVHYHFPKKDDLVKAVIFQYREACLDFLNGLNLNEVDPKNRLKEVVKLFICTKKESKMCLAGILVALYEEIGEGAQLEVDLFFEEFTEGIRKIISELIKEDRCRINISAADFSKLLISAMEGALLIDRRSDKHGHLKSCTKLIDSFFI